MARCKNGFLIHFGDKMSHLRAGGVADTELEERLVAGWGGIKRRLGPAARDILSLTYGSENSEQIMATSCASPTAEPQFHLGEDQPMETQLRATRSAAVSWASGARSTRTRYFMSVRALGPEVW